jgi:predicted O-methyltransferase YrrM
LRGHYLNRQLPKSGPNNVDSYSDFLEAVRRWMGAFGTSAMAWSFYGTSDGRDANVYDPRTLNLYATLHSLIRSNGCSRVLEVGTARGVSAACIACAIVDRPDPSVVTFDPYYYEGRHELWGCLPKPIRSVIEERRYDGIVGMSELVESGNHFHAALLDSIHTTEHVMKEFRLVTQLVCEGGIILIHDPLWRGGTVGQAVDDISKDGYRVVTLWSAEEGLSQDDRLGLALVENRRF